MRQDNDKRAQYQQLFEKELLPHIHALNTFAFHLTLNEQDANDLVQETYLKAYRFIDKYEQGSNAKAWLFKILKNAFINQYRKKNKDTISLETSSEVGKAGSGDTFDDSTRESLIDFTMGDEVSLALDQLSVEYKTVLLLCDVEGFSYEEISQILDIPIGTVRSRLHRARAQLKEKLKNYARNMGYTDEKT